MSLAPARKAEVIKTYATKAGDTGSPEVQVAVLSERITHLTEQVQKIISFVRSNNGCTGKQLLEQFTPADETRVLADLHWLIQDGYVIEFSNGRLWALADKPAKTAPEVSAPPAAAATSDPASGADRAAAAGSSAEAS